MRVSVTGATPPTALVSGQSIDASGSIVVDSSYVYWANPSAGLIQRVPIVGGTAETVASGQTHPSSVARDSHGIYWFAGGIVTLQSGQAQPQLLAASSSTGSPISVGGGYVYWVESDGSIRRIPTQGGNAETIASQQGGASLAVDGSILLYMRGGMLMGLDL